MQLINAPHQDEITRRCGPRQAIDAATADVQNLRLFAHRQVMQLVAGSLTYSALNLPAYLTAGDDQEEEIGKRFEAKNVLLGGFARSAFSSVIPTTIDTALVESRLSDPLFAFSRASGSAMGGFAANPMASALQGPVRWGKGAYEAFADEREMTQPEVMGIFAPLPFSNWLPIQTLLRALTAEKPLRKQD